MSGNHQRVLKNTGAIYPYGPFHVTFAPLVLNIMTKIPVAWQKQQLYNMYIYIYTVKLSQITKLKTNPDIYWIVTPQFVVCGHSWPQSFKTIPTGPWETRKETLMQFLIGMNQFLKPLCCLDLCFIPKIIAEITVFFPSTERKFHHMKHHHHSTAWQHPVRLKSQILCSKFME